MNSQEIFDASVGFIIKQGRPSMDDNGSCKYRGCNGERCAVGALIPDALYDPAMEGRGVGGPLIVQALRDLGLLANPRAHMLLRQLQATHDGAARSVGPSEFLEEFYFRASQLCKKSYLKWNF